MSKMQSMAGGKIYTNDNFQTGVISFSESNSQNTTNATVNMADGSTFTTASTSYVDVLTLNIQHPLQPDTRGLYAFELTSTASFSGGAPILSNNKVNGDDVRSFARVIVDAGGSFGLEELYSCAFANDNKTTNASTGKTGFMGFFTLEPTATLLSRTMRFQVRSSTGGLTTSARNLRLRWWRVI